MCVISDTDAKRLFGTDDVVGMSIDVTCYDVTKSFRIMGVTTQKENGTFVSYTYEGMPVNINIPYSAMNELVGDVDYFYSITVQSDTSRDSQKIANRDYPCSGKARISAQGMSIFRSRISRM